MYRAYKAMSELWSKKSPYFRNVDSNANEKIKKLKKQNALLRQKLQNVQLKYRQLKHYQNRSSNKKAQQLYKSFLATILRSSHNNEKRRKANIRQNACNYCQKQFSYRSAEQYNHMHQCRAKKNAEYRRNMRFSLISSNRVGAAESSSYGWHGLAYSSVINENTNDANLNTNLNNLQFGCDFDTMESNAMKVNSCGDVSSSSLLEASQHTSVDQNKTNVEAMDCITNNKACTDESIDFMHSESSLSSPKMHGNSLITSITVTAPSRMPDGCEPIIENICNTELTTNIDNVSVNFSERDQNYPISNSFASTTNEYHSLSNEHTTNNESNVPHILPPYDLHLNISHEFDEDIPIIHDSTATTNIFGTFENSDSFFNEANSVDSTLMPNINRNPKCIENSNVAASAGRWSSTKIFPETAAASISGHSLIFSESNTSSFQANKQFEDKMSSSDKMITNCAPNDQSVEKWIEQLPNYDISAEHSHVQENGDHLNNVETSIRYNENILHFETNIPTQFVDLQAYGYPYQNQFENIEHIELCIQKHLKNIEKEVKTASINCQQIESTPDQPELIKSIGNSEALRNGRDRDVNFMGPSTKTTTGQNTFEQTTENTNTHILPPHGRSQSFENANDNNDSSNIVQDATISAFTMDEASEGTTVRECYTLPMQKSMDLISSVSSSLELLAACVDRAEHHLVTENNFNGDLHNVVSDYNLNDLLPTMEQNEDCALTNSSLSALDLSNNSLNSQTSLTFNATLCTGNNSIVSNPTIVIQPLLCREISTISSINEKQEYLSIFNTSVVVNAIQNGAELDACNFSINTIKIIQDLPAQRSCKCCICKARYKNIEMCDLSEKHCIRMSPLHRICEGKKKRLSFVYRQKSKNDACNECLMSLVDVSTKFNQRRIDCSICGKILGSTNSLKGHYMIHMGIKNYACGVCRKPMRHASSLKVHERTHLERKVKRRRRKSLK